MDAAGMDRAGVDVKHSVWPPEARVLRSTLGRQAAAHGKAECRPPGAARGLPYLLSLNEICLQPDPVTARLVVAALLSHCLEQLVGLEMRVSRSRDLFLAVQDYLEEHLSQPLTRESVAKRFHITPNYLSHIFQKSGSVGFNEFLTSVRLEKAKKLLRGYDLKVKEIAHNCGFVDSNYFCRVFKRYTERSPSEYRRHLPQRAAGIVHTAHSTRPRPLFLLYRARHQPFNKLILRLVLMPQANANANRQRVVVVNQDCPGVLQNRVRQFIHFLQPTGHQR